MAVEDFCIFMLRREVLAYKGKKMFSNVCGYLFAERGVEPDYGGVDGVDNFLVWAGT